MTRLVFALVVAMALSGCQQSGQVTDPFWGRTIVPSPPTGSINAPMVSQGYPQTLPPQGTMQTLPPQGTMIPGTLPPNGGFQPAQPNLLPPPAGTPGTVTPTPATPLPAGGGLPYGNATGFSAPPASNPLAGRSPSSGYSNPDLPPPGGFGSAAAKPGMGPTAIDPGKYSPGSTTATSFGSSTGGAAPMTPGPVASPPPGPTAAPTPAGLPPSASPPSGAPSGYFPPNGSFNYQGGTQGPPERSGWVAPSGLAATPVTFDDTIVSAPPGTTTSAGAPSTPGLDAGRIVRIPTSMDSGSAVPPAGMGP